MKKAILLAAIVSVSAAAQDHNEVTIFDKRIVVEVKHDQPGGGNEQPFWDLLNSDGWEAAKQAITGIDVSDNLTDEIAYRESLDGLKKLIKGKQHRAAESVLSDYPEWKNCERVQWLWQDLKNEAASGYGPKATEKYQYLLDNCSGHELSTTQMLLGWTRPGAANKILTQYQNSAAYNKVEGDKLWRSATLGKLANRAISNTDMANIGGLVKAEKDAKSAELLGWRYLKKEKAQPALYWFDKSIHWSGATAKRIEGRLLSLQMLGETEQLTVEHEKWSPKYPSIANLSFGSGEDGLACDDSVAQCLESLQNKKELTASDYALQGWKFYELDRPISSTGSFEKALDLMDKEDEQWGLTQYGYVLALEQSGYTKKAQSHAMRVDNKQGRAVLEQKVAMKRVFSAYKNAAYEVTLARINEYEIVYGKNVDLTEIKAWSLYKANRKREALKVYTKLAEAFPYNKDYQHSYMIIKCSMKKKSSQCRQYNT